MTCHACHLCGARTRPGEWFCKDCYEDMALKDEAKEREREEAPDEA